MRPDLVVLLESGGYGHRGLMQCLEPALVQVLVAKLAVEALDVGVLHMAPGLDQDVADAVRLRLRHECAAS